MSDFFDSDVDLLQPENIHQLKVVDSATFSNRYDPKAKSPVRAYLEREVTEEEIEGTLLFNECHVANELERQALLDAYNDIEREYGRPPAI